MRIPMRSWALIVAIVALLFSSETAHAWEQDVHHLLTRWLAIRAGFTTPNADLIAAGNQSLDDSYHAGAIGSVVWMIVSGDVLAARSAQEKHFPSDGGLPSPPFSRVVSRNSARARAKLESVIFGATPNTNLRELGEALHPFQDSWSHQGVPDPPFGLRPDLTVGHPLDRGGWRRHDADYTHLHQDEILEVAKETYDFLLRMLRKTPNLADPGATPSEWASLVPSVRAFARAFSKEQKNAWAKAQAKALGDSALAISQTSLPGDTNPRRWVPLAARDVEPRRGSSIESGTERPSAELIGSAQRLMDDWFKRQNIEEASQRVDWNALSEQLPELKNDRSQVIEWCQKFMTIALDGHHDIVNILGHGDPRESGYERLPRTVAEVKGGPIPNQVVILSEEHFMRVRSEQFTHYAVVLKSSESSHDSIVLVWRDSGQLVRMLSIVD